MVERSMIDLAGNRIGPSLSDVLGITKGKRREFTIYLWAKRAVALLTDPNRPEGRNPGVTLDDALQVIKELETHTFQLAAQKVYDWNDGVLNYAAQASPTFAGVVAKIRKADPGYYIPLQREFRELDELWARSRGSSANAESGSISKRLKGSGRRIKDPFQAMIANATEVVEAAHRRRTSVPTARLRHRASRLLRSDRVPRQSRRHGARDPSPSPPAEALVTRPRPLPRHTVVVPAVAETL